jgi:hypothetical protein
LRKLILALCFALVLSLVLGSMMVFAANGAEPGNPLYAIDQGVDSALSFLQEAVTVTDFSPQLVAAEDDIPLTPTEPVVTETPPVPEDAGNTADDPLGPAATEAVKVSAYCPCDPLNPHPVGEKLTNKYLGGGEDFAIKYTEIMTLFCEGKFGFGEIDKGLSIALAAGVDASDVFALRDTGLGWGVIRKQYNLPKFPSNPTHGLGNGNAFGNANPGGNGNAYGNNNTQGNGNPGGNGNGNAYGRTKNGNNGNIGGKVKH